ncbi:hypothetical protein JHK85_016379 [Glycine max]|nr:hypothetical protein JHK85_016379 [Glycine max]KAG5046599.1 hypothetical protein JHK86_016005 [Glycine max]
MEVDLPLGWKPLHLECYDGTRDLDKHLDVFLTQENLYTNDDTIMGNIDMVQRTLFKVHRQLRHPCRTLQLSVYNQSVTPHDICRSG